jgi:hypothetical protein
MIRTIASGCVLFLLAAPVSATIIHLDGYGAGGVSSGTADRTTGGSGVAIGNGWTPNIAVAYDTLTTAFVPANRGLGTWGGGYGDLDPVSYPQAPDPDFGNFYGAWWFTPDPGYSVRINSFDMGGYNSTDKENQPIFIRTASGQILWDASGHVEGNNGHSSFTPNVTSTETLYIIFGDNWNTGIDNINFDQAAIPEPSSVAIAGLLVGSLALRYVRKRRGVNA